MIGSKLGIDSLKLGIDSLKLGIDSLKLGIDSLKLGIDSSKLGIDKQYIEKSCLHNLTLRQRLFFRTLDSKNEIEPAHIPYVRCGIWTTKMDSGESTLFITQD